MKSARNYIIGVDEAGRGPLAGPIAVGALAMKIKSRLDRKTLKNVKDSKKLSAKKRMEWLEIFKNNFEYRVSMVGPAVIDKIGIQKSTRLAVARALRKFPFRPRLVLLDGLMSAPKCYKQKTVIKGDEKIPLIAAASIVAKVARDKKMLKLHEKFPEYRLDLHKGYGTRLHYKCLKKYGSSCYHRKSYLQNLA